ncbi:hypothetical protein [Pyrobaculum aerophilum]|uniref:hypothetical protein n=1 Tax=Pyrobaculum aerophilum TaxID=13773 RepID=UPI002163CC1D|nr:hypothetical protein [Pyrobaculum aerophilum]
MQKLRIKHIMLATFAVAIAITLLHITISQTPQVKPPLMDTKATANRSSISEGHEGWVSPSDTVPAPRADNGETRRGFIRLYVEDDLGPINGSVFVLPAAPQNYTMPSLIKPAPVSMGRGVAPGYAVEIIRNWTSHRVHNIGVMLVVVNGTDVAIATAVVDPREVAKALDSRLDYEIRAKVKGKIKRQDKGRGPLSLAACPEAQMFKEDEFQGGWITTPLMRVKNNADVSGTFSIGLASVYEKRFSFGIALQEDIRDWLNVNFRIEAYAYSLGAQYAGSDGSTIPPKGGVKAISIYTWGRYEIYRIEYYISDPSGCSYGTRIGSTGYTQTGY